LPADSPWQAEVHDLRLHAIPFSHFLGSRFRVEHRWDRLAVTAMPMLTAYETGNST